MNIFDAHVDVQDLLDQATAATNDYEEGRQTFTRERMAGMALQLARLNDDVLEVLEGLKEALRAEAAPLSAANDGVVRLTGWSDSAEELGHVTVTFPRRDVKLSKRTDVDHLKRVLGTRFKDYFEEKTTVSPVKDFEARTEAAMASGSPGNPAEGRIALQAVTVQEATPRVGFKPGYQA
jgi:hypothetical protein